MPTIPPWSVVAVAVRSSGFGDFLGPSGPLAGAVGSALPGWGGAVPLGHPGLWPAGSAGLDNLVRDFFKKRKANRLKTVAPQRFFFLCNL